VADIAVLVDVLRRLTEGECVIDPTIVTRLMRRRRPDSPLERLTDREREILALMAEERSNSGIASTLPHQRADGRGLLCRDVLLRYGGRRPDGVRT
jgi:DNA-binding NarL/FixJ family response regulator